MSLGSNTQVVDGQRNLFPTRDSYMPASYGAQTTGVPQVSPFSPPFAGAGNAGGAGSGNVHVDGFGTADNNALTTGIANANPFNVKVSPVWWAVGSLVVGLVLLRAIHWRKVVEGHEALSVGPASERADAEA